MSASLAYISVCPSEEMDTGYMYLRTEGGIVSSLGARLGKQKLKVGRGSERGVLKIRSKLLLSTCYVPDRKYFM